MQAKVTELGQELSNNQKNIMTSDISTISPAMFSTIEPTLLRLNQFVNEKIKWSDFTSEDKQSMVELFVTHQATLNAIYLTIFPQTTNIDRGYQNLNVVAAAPSESIRLQTEADSLEDMLNSQDQQHSDDMTTFSPIK